MNVYVFQQNVDRNDRAHFWDRFNPWPRHSLRLVVGPKTDRALPAAKHPLRFPHAGRAPDLLRKSEGKSQGSTFEGRCSKVKNNLQ
jgi:hypothetical protein